MKIRTKLHIITAAALGIILAMGAILFNTVMEVNRTMKESRTVNDIIRGLVEMNILTTDYVLNNGERAKMQWVQKHATLDVLLAKSDFIRSDDRAILENILANHREIRKVFGEIVKIHESSFQMKDAAAAELIQRLVGQLDVRTQMIASNASLLGQRSRDRMSAMQGRAVVIAIASVGIVGLFMIAISVMFDRSVVRPIHHLHAGTEIIGAGNLDHKVGMPARDEIGQLSRAFDDMTGQLKNVMISRDELVREVEDRRKAEEALARSNRELTSAIAERKSAEEKIMILNAELNANLEQLNAVNKELEAFSYSVSHDLRAPLRAVDGFSKIIIEDYGSRFDGECTRLFNVISDNTRKMSSLIDDLLAFSRLGRQEMKKMDINTTALVSQIVENLKAAPENIKRNIEVKIGALPKIHGDNALIGQVFVNLVSNAFKFTRAREKAVIEIGHDQKAFFVRDNGAGFDMRYTDKLFGVFQRLHSSSEFEGTGIGLALVKRIIVRHGGKIWAEGEEGKGATFYFSLPT